MLSVENDATPATAETVTVPDSVAPGVPVPARIATVTLPVNVVIGWPNASRAVTWIAGVIFAPAVVVLGCAVKASDVLLTSKGVLVAPGKPFASAVRVYPLPGWSTLRSANVATPATAAAVFVPASAPPPGFAPRPTVTLPVNPVAVLSKPSRAVICTAGVIVAPAEVIDGCTVKTRCVGAPVLIVNAALVVVESPADEPSSV